LTFNIMQHQWRSRPINLGGAKCMILGE